MFSIIKLALQVFLKQYSLGEEASCREFIENLLKVIKPAAAASKTELDDKILAHLDVIVKNETLFSFFHNLVREQFESEVVLFDATNDLEISRLCETALKETAQAINPLIIVGIVTQIIALINALKK